MREIKELISLEDAKKLIGATVQGAYVDVSETVERNDMSRGVVTGVSVDYENDLLFSLDGGGNAWLQSPDAYRPWYLEILQEPPTADPVRLDENTPLEELQRYVGAVVRRHPADSSNVVDDDTFTVFDVHRSDCGEFYLNGGTRPFVDGWWLESGDYVTVVQDPPQATETPDEAPSTETLTERVERLKDELKTAEDALAGEGLPPGWTNGRSLLEIKGPCLWESDKLLEFDASCQEVTVHVRSYGEGHNYAWVIPFRALATIVDRVRAENPDT